MLDPVCTSLFTGDRTAARVRGGGPGRRRPRGRPATAVGA